MLTDDEPLDAILVDEPEERAPQVADAGSTASQWTQFANNTGLLLATLFFVTAILGVPLIFYSTKLSQVQKVLLTVVVTLYTAALLYGTYLILVWSWNRALQL